jgi:hypothetical protein
MVSKFREVLHVLENPIDPSVRLGVCAMGPVADGDELTWMRVWVAQQDGARVALASGTSGEHLGGHELSDMEVLPFTDKKGWMVQTQLEPGSEEFSPGKPALAMAMALVRHQDGTRDVEQWSQAITVAGHGHDDDHDHHH